MRYHQFKSLFKNNIATNQYMATNKHNNSQGQLILVLNIQLINFAPLIARVMNIFVGV